MGSLKFLQGHHIQHLDQCPHVPAAVASQKAVIFRNVEDLSHFHSRWVGRQALRLLSGHLHADTHHTLHTHSTHVQVPPGLGLRGADLIYPLVHHTQYQDIPVPTNTGMCTWLTHRSAYNAPTHYNSCT